MASSIEKIVRRHPSINADVIANHKWFCLCAESQKEFLIQDLLQIFGFLTYVPVRKEWKFANGVSKIKRQKKLYSYPQMNGYVLIGFRSEQMHAGHTPHWLNLWNERLVFGVVGTNGRPMEINQQSLMQFSQSHPNGLQRPEHEAFMRTHKEFSVGDNVKVCEGPFDGQILPVIEIDGSKAKLNMNLFGGSREISVDTFALEKVA